MMTNLAHLSTLILHSRFQRMVLALATIWALTMTVTRSTQAQTFTVLHNFTGGIDGYDPGAGVAVGPSGVVYGAASFGGAYGSGTVFKLNQVNSSWVFSPLHEFTGGSDGQYPFGGVTIGPNGALYGTTSFGGISPGFGVVYELRPPPTACSSALCYWNETVLHSFTGQPPDGGIPGNPILVFDPAGDIYGTTYYGGVGGYGIVFELIPSGGGYTENVIHSFGYPAGGSYPNAGVVLDTAGNVYGTTTYGGTGTGCMDNCGTVYQLVPSGGNWTENVLVNFDSDGMNGQAPLTAPLIDASGNLYGTAGIVYKLAPLGGGFTYSVISNLDGAFCGYQSPLVMDAAGNLYGTCQNGPGAGGQGWIFELANCSQTCTVLDLHQFNGTQGGGPLGALALDANGNLYGTTVAGGTGGTGCNNGGCGVVWELSGVTEGLRR